MSTLNRQNSINDNAPAAQDFSPHEDDPYSPHMREAPPTALPPPAPSYVSLAQRLHARRAEYTRPHEIRIKVGSWNVGASKGTEKDVSGWFVEGKGIAESFTSLKISPSSESYRTAGTSTSSKDGNSSKLADDISTREDPAAQEERWSPAESTLPRGDIEQIPGGQEIGLYVLGLQEVVDISSATEALRPYVDPTVANKYKQAITEALPAGYTLVAEQQLVGLLLFIYAAPDVAPHVRSVSTTSVGTGLLGYMGNKGAVTARIVLGETTRLVFVNSHMSAGNGKAELERRNWDASQILSRTKFAPVLDGNGVAIQEGEKIGDEDFAFWFGDLNYRLRNIPGEDVRRILLLHARNAYDVGQHTEQKIEKEISDTTDLVLENRIEKNIKNTDPNLSANNSNTHQLSRESSFSRQSTFSATTRKSFEEAVAQGADPTSLQATINSLLRHDELLQQMKTHKMFHDGWREGPITFLPTYKYDHGKFGMFDSSEKKRSPSWCDRILFRTKQDLRAYERRKNEEAEARLKDASMKAQGVDHAADDEEELFAYDPDTDGETPYSGVSADQDPMKVINNEGLEDSISLEYYASHQSVLSSDHKPLNAVFTLKYDAIIPELKSQVQEDVARELDKAENEGRPTLTLVIDGENNQSTDTAEGVDFGYLKYENSKTRQVTIANTGQSVASFGLVDRGSSETTSSHWASRWLVAYIDREPNPNSNSVRKSNKSGRSRSSSFKEKYQKNDQSDGEALWSREVQHTYTMDPGDTCSLYLTAEVSDIDLVRSLNDGETLEDVLVLKVKDGPDHFLPVRARWLASSHGRTLDKLIRIPEGGVRRLQRQHPEASSGKDPEAQNQRSDDHQSHTGKPSHSGKNDSQNRDKQHGSQKHEQQDSRQAGEQRGWKDSDLAASPVTWSAPRELFRLSAAIESLVERIVGEWSMLGPDLTGDGRPPWESYTGWPFDTDSWTLGIEARRELRANVNEALDTDSNLDNALSMHMPQLHRLEVLAESLILFLRNMLDGVITQPLWTKVEREFFAVRDKKYARLSLDEQRSAILDILSAAPNHSITFVLLTSMLARIAREVTGAHALPDKQAAPGSPMTAVRDGAVINGSRSVAATLASPALSTFSAWSSSTVSPVPGGESQVSLPRSTVRRYTLDVGPGATRRHVVDASFAAIFGDVLIQCSAAQKTKSKDPGIAQRRELVRIFLAPDIAG